MNRLFSVCLIFILNSTTVIADGSRYKDFNDDHLKYGKTIWMENCEGCHGWGIADAPIPMNYDEWEFRIEKGKDVLYQHAIEGFFGIDHAMMPERGGNLSLTDAEVKAAVDYMFELAVSHKK